MGETKEIDQNTALPLYFVYVPTYVDGGSRQDPRLDPPDILAGVGESSQAKLFRPQGGSTSWNSSVMNE